MATVTLGTLGRLEELEDRLDDLGLEDYREAVDAALQALGSPRFRFLRTGEAARALGVSIPTVKRWGKQGILPIERVRGRWLIPAESVAHLNRAKEALAATSGSLDRIGEPLSREQQRRILHFGRKASRGTLTPEEEREYLSLIREANERSVQAAVASVAARDPQKAAALATKVAALRAAAE
jgi:excisionase family DNA binding protein